jgi:DNA uptake protein ComE-like DNA-binding protein
VAASEKNRTHSVDDWLIEPANRPAEDAESETEREELVLDEDRLEEPETDGRSIEPDAAQWLVEPEPGTNGRTPAKTDAPAIAEDPVPEPPAPAPVESRATAAPPRRDDSKELQRLNDTLEAERAKIAELEETLAQREAELEQTLREREAEFAQALRERDEALKEREAELSERLSQGYEKREADLNREFDRRQIELEKQLAVLEDRLDAREAELRDRATQREAKLMARIEELQSQLADAKLGMSETPAPKRSRRGSSRNGQLYLNDASFEQLRELGLSVTQTARVIAYRDTRGGFDSLDELDEIPGLPKETRVALASRLRL